MLEVAMTCPCGSHLVVSECATAKTAHGYSCHCPDCYGPVDDSGPLDEIIGHGSTPEEAIAEWSERAEELWEIMWEPVTLFAELSEQVGDEADRQSEWCMREADGWPNAIWYLPPATEDRSEDSEPEDTYMGRYHQGERNWLEDP